MGEFTTYTYKGYPAGLKYPWTYPMPSEKERDRRWTAIRKAMKKNNFDCLLVTKAWGYMPLPNHLYYISNFVSYAFSGTYVVFPLVGEPQLGLANFNGPQFQHIATEKSWIKEIVASLYPAKDIINKVKQLKLENGRLGIIGYRIGVFPASILDALREGLPSATFTDATEVLGEAMNEVSRTSEEEFTFLKRSCEILDLCFEAIASSLKPGVKECELWAAAEQAIVKNGGWYPHFMLATSGPSPIFPRAPASQNVLARGDVVIFEINVTCGGVSPQSCCALSIGKPKKELEEMFELCKKLYQFSLAELEKNKTFIDIEKALVDRIHGAGYEPSTPQIHIYNNHLVGNMPMGSPPQPGDYFTVHPNIADKDYTMAAKIGDAVRINKDRKVERLQKTPAELTIV